jgi:uncharacterized protein (TIGR01777 family)
MRVFVTGGTGFIGKQLIHALIGRGDECVVVTRSGQDLWNSEQVEILKADPGVGGDWQESISGVDAVINLAGERIVDPPRRWTPHRKQRLSDSRVKTTANIVDAIRRAKSPPELLLSGSAIGYYGPRGDEKLDETADPGHDFLASLSRKWEEAAVAIEDIAPVALLRTGIVLGKGGGALDSLLPSFRLGVGGPWGDGRQWWSWIHMEDEVGLVLFILDRKLDGAFNLTAPKPVTVNEFAKSLGKALKRPAWIRAPGVMLRAGLGAGASALLDLQRVVPARALECGYEFRFPTVAEALHDLV